VPSDALKAMVFPWIDEWISKRDAGLVIPTICLDSFLKAMDFLKVVFLQDSVCLKAMFPNLVIWNDGLFLSSEYQEFESQLRDCIRSSSEPNDLRLRDVLPDLSAKLNDEFVSLHSNVLANRSVTEQVQSSLSRLTSKIDDIFAGRTSVNVNFQLSEAGSTINNVQQENGMHAS
jgi:hypothetical protein